jgi:hypothetical protein
MAPAAEVLGSYARAVSTHDPRIRLLSNRDGGVVQQGHEALDRSLIKFVDETMGVTCNHVSPHFRAGLPL